MSDIRDQIENIKSDLRAVEMGLQQALRAVERVPGRNELQNLMVEADEDINPNSDGKCFAMFRLGTPREFKKRTSTAITVYNHSEAKTIKEGDQFMVALDVWGTYYRIEGGGGDLIAVDLVQTGGEQGDADNMPSWEYSIFLASDRNAVPTPDPILEDVDPTQGTHKWRRHLGQMESATHGYGFYNVDGDFEVCWINEILIAAICEEEETP